MIFRKNKTLQPVFIHSLFRSGSTYIYNVFRRSVKEYYCYQEPLNEFLIFLNSDASKLFEEGSETAQNLRHPTLTRPYFWEFYENRKVLSGLFQKSFSYDEFFPGSSLELSEEQTQYFDALIAHAKGCPVFQMCRSGGRVGAFKKLYGGIHIHLWREPRNQWWSFKINDYFDPAVQLIYNSWHLPPVLAEIKRQCGMGEFHDGDVSVEFQHARRSPLSAKENYISFYALWLYTFMETEKYADVTLNIDALSVDESYRESSLKSLADIGVNDLDFGDCLVPQALFSKKEVEFFQLIERQVRSIFIGQGYNELDIDKTRIAHESVIFSGSYKNNDLQRDAVRARDIVCRYLDSFALQENMLERYRKKIEKLEALNVGLENELSIIRMSKSWRLTSPLRSVMRLARKLLSL